MEKKAMEWFYFNQALVFNFKPKLGLSQQQQKYFDKKFLKINSNESVPETSVVVSKYIHK